MDLSRPENPNKWSVKFATRLGKAFRSEKQYSEAAVQEKRKQEASKLQKKSRQPAYTAPAPEVNELGERVDYTVYDDAIGPKRVVASRKQIDIGDTLHGLAHYGSFDSLLDHTDLRDELRDPYFDSRVYKRRAMIVSDEHERRVSSLPDELWKRIICFLDPVDAVNLGLATKTLHRKLGMVPFQALNQPENRNHKIALLRQWDHRLPNHLLCFPCAKYHCRLAPGKEVLKMDFVKNPIFLCPKVRDSVLPRMRLVHGRELPYYFVQMALRSFNLGKEYGISHESLSRRWKDKQSGWAHHTRYMVHDGRLLLRVVSQIPTPPAAVLTETAERHILYDREEYTPFFSVCAHWRDGDLTKICKCVMSHVPSPPDPYRKQIQRSLKLNRAAAHPDFIVRGCDECRPARRCPECPTEYMIEVQMIEDPKDKDVPFKHALTVTRWSDLGDGSNPYTSPEWVAINETRSTRPSAGGVVGSSHPATEIPVYDSFSHIGRRAVGGIFESHISGANPGQRLVSLNPSNKKMGEAGNGWY